MVQTVQSTLMSCVELETGAAYLGHVSERTGKVGDSSIATSLESSHKDTGRQKHRAVSQVKSEKGDQGKLGSIASTR